MNDSEYNYVIKLIQNDIAAMFDDPIRFFGSDASMDEVKGRLEIIVGAAYKMGMIDNPIFEEITLCASSSELERFKTLYQDALDT